MRSFTFALIAAAFATVVSTAPVASPLGLSSLPNAPNTVKVVDTAVGPLDDKTKPLLGAVQVPAIPAANNPSLPTRGDEHPLYSILDEFSTDCHPSVEQLKSVSTSDVTQIKGIVAVIQGRIDAAVLRVKALVDGKVTTVDRLAYLLASILKPILIAVGCILDVVGDDVKTLLRDLIADLFVLVGAVCHLVDGLADELGPLITDVGYVIVKLGVDISQYGLTC